MDDLPPGVYRVCGKYRLWHKIGSGSFGDVYSADNVIRGEAVAIKMEPLTSSCPKLRHEWDVYRALGQAPGIPQTIWFGTESGYKALVMERLGPSLEDTFNLCKRKFSLKTVLMMIPPMITCIEHVHHCGYVHRDIKPENFVIGMHDRDCIYIIDFGLTTSYLDNDHHIPLTSGNSLLGSAHYVSINTHNGFQQSQHDDLEPLAYMFIYFLCGSLPWQHLEAQSKTQQFSKIMRQKKKISSGKLCHNLFKEFQVFLDYVRNLAFDATPNYTFILELFNSLLRGLGAAADSVFDWTSKVPKVEGSRPQIDTETSSEDW